MKEIANKMIRTCLKYAEKHKRGVLFAMLLVIILIVIAGSLMEPSSDSESRKYKDAEAVKVDMIQTLTAACEITAGSTESIFFDTSKTFKSMCVEENETVVKGQHLIAYEDGTNDDAPGNGLVSAIDAPETGTVADSSCRLTFGSTDTLVLDITIPEDEINSVKKGHTATVVVNADLSKEYKGEIISKKEISTTLLSDTDSNGGSSADAESTGKPGTDNGAGNISGAMDPFGSNSSTAYYTVRIRIINDGYVLVGMSASCTITISDRSDVLTVPVESVGFTSKGKAYVRVPDGDKTRKVYVVTGDSDANNVEITKGLEEGTIVKVPILT